MECPCGSGQSYAECCGPIIKGERPAATAEALMRARYSAFTQVEMDFLRESMHPDVRGANDPDSTRDWAENSTWLGLEIRAVTAGGPEDETGDVEFIASFEYDGDFSPYHEIAHFEKLDGQWYFKEGTKGVLKPVVREEPKVGRNDPCPCGSGRKFKRCCGG